MYTIYYYVDRAMTRHGSGGATAKEISELPAPEADIVAFALNHAPTPKHLYGYDGAWNDFPPAEAMPPERLQIDDDTNINVTGAVLSTYARNPTIVIEHSSNTRPEKWGKKLSLHALAAHVAHGDPASRADYMRLHEAALAWLLARGWVG